MLIHPWDAALDAAEWQDWLASTDRFGMLAVNNLDPAQAPLVVPTHFTVAGDELLRPPGPAEPGLAAPGGSRRGAAGRDRRLRLHPDVLAGQGRRARRGRRADQLLHAPCSSSADPRSSTTPRARSTSSTAQLADFQPEGRHATVAVDAPPYGRMLPGIRGIRLAVLRVDAKFKYDDHNPVEHRERVIGNLEERGHGLDTGAAAQQRRRLDAIGEWRRPRLSPGP